jgi:hypothetical protein
MNKTASRLKATLRNIGIPSLFSALHSGLPNHNLGPEAIGRKGVLPNAVVALDLNV